MAASNHSSSSLHEQRLCDWERSVTNCKDPDFIKATLIACATLHLLVSAYGIWVLWYRNGGFKNSMVTNVFIVQRNNIRPRPIDCIAFFTTVACFIKVLGVAIIVLDVMPPWFQLLVQQIYWWLALSVTSATYVIGALYALPVTECEGSFAVYRPQEIDPSNLKAPIYLFYPTPNQRDVFLLFSLTIPFICILVPGFLSQAFEAQGHSETAAVLESVHYTVFGVHEYAWSLVVLYYGLKFTFVLRAHITATEARDHIPPKAFGLSDLKSGSPARYLLIMVRITVTARGIILLLGGTMAHIRAWERGDFLRPENERWSHVMAVVWTCAMTIAYTAQLTLIAVHCSRNRPKTANKFENGISPLQMASGDSGLDMLTLHLNTDQLGSGSEISLNQALSRLAKAYQSGEQPTDYSMRLETDRSRSGSEFSLERAMSQLAEPSQSNEQLTEFTISSGDLSREADTDEEDLRKRVARSIPISRSIISLAKEAPKPGAARSRFSVITNEQQLGMQEFRQLQLQHHSSQRRIRTLKVNHRHSVGAQKLLALQRQLQGAHRSLEQLQTYYLQLHPSPGYQQSEGSAQMDPAENLRQLHLQSNISILQQQVKFTLRQLDHQTWACQSELTDSSSSLNSTPRTIKTTTGS